MIESRKRYEAFVGIALCTVLALIRAPLLGAMHRPAIIWDEMTYLSFARLFAGAGPAVDFRFDPNVEHAGYGLLLAPAFATHAPFDVAYHLALAINLCLSAAFGIGVFFVARRLAGASLLLSALTAGAVTAFPSVFLLPLFVFSENVIYPLAIFSVYALYRAVRDGKAGWHVAFALSMAALWFAHAAAIVVVAVGLGTLGALWWKKLISLQLAAVDCAIIVIGCALAQIVHHQVWPLSWGNETDTALGPQFLAALSPGGLLEAVRALSYQQAALAIGTLGMYPVAVVTLVRVVREDGESALRVAAAYALAATAAAGLMSGFFISTIPHWLDQPHLVFSTRYADEGMLVALALGLPLAFVRAVPTRPLLYTAVASVVVLGTIATPAFNGAWFLNPGAWINELALGGLARFLVGTSLPAVCSFAVAVVAAVMYLRRRNAAAAFALLSCIWLFADAGGFRGQITLLQARYDELIGAPTSALVGYFDALPQDVEVGYSAQNLNILTYNLLALSSPRHHFVSVLWPAASPPPWDAVVAPDRAVGAPFTEVTCEKMDPVECLFVRDPLTARYLIKLVDEGAFAPAARAHLGSGIELAVDPGQRGKWEGIHGLEHDPAGVAFRWTNGDAQVSLPALDAPPHHVHIELVAPNAGQIVISITPPGEKTTISVRGNDVKGPNAYDLTLPSPRPGTKLRIQTTNRVSGTADIRKLSVEVRSVTLLP